MPAPAAKISHTINLCEASRLVLGGENFLRFKGCWIGPAALDMLKAGKRLTQAEQSPPEYDLKWPGDM